MIQNWIKRRAIKKYYRYLPDILARDYARSSFYSLGQIRTAIKNNKLPKNYEPYAVVMFTSFEDTGTVFQKEYPDINGYKIRAEVADLIFGGNMHYSVKKQIKFSEHGNDGGDPMPGGTQ